MSMRNITNISSASSQTTADPDSFILPETEIVTPAATRREADAAQAPPVPSREVDSTDTENSFELSQSSEQDVLSLRPDLR